MNLEIIHWLLLLFGGFLLGIIYFVGLWYTTKNLMHWKNPALGMVFSLFMRLVIVVSGFYWFTDGQWQELLVVLLGFIVTRIIMIRRYGPAQKIRDIGSLNEHHAR